MKKRNLAIIETLLESEKSAIIESYKRITATLDLIGIEYGYTTKEYREALQKVIEIIPTNKISQRQILSYIECTPSYSHVSSQISDMRFKQHLKEIDLELSPWENDKSIDQSFAKALEIPTPEILHTKIKLNDIAFEPKTVLKPFFGSTSRHVFYIHDLNNIVEVSNNKTFTSIESLLSNLESRNLDDLWQVETLIYNHTDYPAHDIKVYCYYGEVGCVLEVKRSDKAYRCWYDSNKELLKKEEKEELWIDGEGFDDRVLEYAKKISKAMPVPFMRIDFYKGKDNYYLGELTPHPGRYFPEYSTTLDSKLGLLFEKAKARLFKDLVNGKTFDLYFQFYKK